MPTLLSSTTEVQDHVYIKVDFKSRTEPRIMRVTVKAYVLHDLQVDFIIGKRDLLASCWIKSKHLHGYDPHVVKQVADSNILMNLLTEAFETYEMDQ